jgi:2-oxoglutarate dehydrogenase E1 component
MIETGEDIDWATAEHLAFGSLLLEGHPVRLSGQDCGRGTFSQRHGVLYDQETEERYIPLVNLSEDQARFEIIDSFLSEEGVLGFEYGYSLADPNSLVLWEAQFGDFCNGAQVYFDQFIAAGEAKWLRMCGLVCLLPHGYEGQGPEHSSARLERFLQLYADDNIQVLYPSTPASYFHGLRRQLNRGFRKPLIVMTPKSLLRHKRCVSTMADMVTGSSFHRVMYERPPSAEDQKVERVVLCSGKVFYDLQDARAERGLEERVALKWHAWRAAGPGAVEEPRDPVPPSAQGRRAQGLARRADAHKGPAGGRCRLRQGAYARREPSGERYYFGERRF